MNSSGVLVNVITVQLCKLLHLGGFPSSYCFSVIILVNSLLLPFVLHAKDGWSTKASPADPLSSSEVNVWAPSLSLVEVVVYPLWAAVSCYWAAGDIVPSLLALFLDVHPTAVQCAALAGAVWMFFVAVLVLVFWRPAALLRRFVFLHSICKTVCNDLVFCSVLCLLGGFLLLVASNALGPINIVYDASSPLFFTVQMLASSDADREGLEGNGGGVYYMLSAVLCVCAFSGLMPLKTVLQRLLYLLTFSYCAARALEQWLVFDCHIWTLLS
jgi:hypothetical protein